MLNLDPQPDPNFNFYNAGIEAGPMSSWAASKYADDLILHHKPSDPHKARLDFEAGFYKDGGYD